MQNSSERPHYLINAYSLLFVIGIVFVTLRLANVIDWPWWIATLPIWIIPVMGLSLVLLVVAAAAVAASLACIPLLLKELRYTIKTKFRRKP
jgi:hypothetical protein